MVPNAIRCYATKRLRDFADVAFTGTETQRNPLSVMLRGSRTRSRRPSFLRLLPSLSHFQANILNQTEGRGRIADLGRYRDPSRSPVNRRMAKLYHPKTTSKWYKNRRYRLPVSGLVQYKARNLPRGGIRSESWCSDATWDREADSVIDPPHRVSIRRSHRKPPRTRLFDNKYAWKAHNSPT